ncbi:hypothetical protein O0I10_000323 [Lichtheimia ornata]|uniref:tRNA-splicing endonuclease subunit Sen15 domain-containing protein n=1 Tax=Lichtheimia ornata TaxID=688661 RepID=A0AAD7Y5A9_9FUNG|nr:uncharacterized protein O0I10_000323 [Lichtheimia ornata]KAJ8664045.1 hypothetical protein O0I10_000323 [Lichtheimia ornata]
MFQDTLDQLEKQTNPEQWPLVRHVYMDLTLAKMWENVQVYPVESLQTSILVGHEPDTPPEQQLVILPILQEKTVSMDRLSSYFKALRAAGFANQKGQALSKLTLAIIAPDSTIVYYHVQPGLVPPSSSNVNNNDDD